MAVLLLPIPIVDLVASPLLLLFGPLLGYIVYRFNSGGANLANAVAKCPDCAKDLQFGPYADVWPLTLRCRHCDAPLRVYQADA